MRTGLCEERLLGLRDSLVFSTRMELRAELTLGLLEGSREALFFGFVTAFRVGLLEAERDVNFAIGLVGLTERGLVLVFEALREGSRGSTLAVLGAAAFAGLLERVLTGLTVDCADILRPWAFAGDLLRPLTGLLAAFVVGLLERTARCLFGQFTSIDFRTPPTLACRALALSLGPCPFGETDMSVWADSATCLTSFVLRLAGLFFFGLSVHASLAGDTASPAGVAERRPRVCGDFVTRPVFGALAAVAFDVSSFLGRPRGLGETVAILLAAGVADLVGG